MTEEIIRLEYSKLRTFQEKLQYIKDSPYLRFGNEGYDWWVELTGLKDCDEPLIEHIEWDSYFDSKVRDLLEFSGFRVNL